ncbi:MAG: Crp/Fnr family transcriptional regulator [Bacteroidales bacterium]|nr:Crp/Fnr family transcriptional regulator [Bacteroidales bacterium]MCF8343891.1 Crp/Fnr family transcriptional regulator [Bacteroidales bacterium]MCF8352361.1 Crp/Fnr family transcriptional regulator [Bacteroidales bacterium]MCF8377483.1 Crp/Fnr family transcriptional regulator [Bacteroidales bacterium]MCF8401606.1 Crp/Fnr family transcriptional regulator [Bacteroidales bacterium]
MAEITKNLRCDRCCFKQEIFTLLSDEEMDRINQNRYEVNFKSHETIFKQGAALTHIACITSGFGKIYIEGFNNKNLILRIFKENEFIGGPGMYTDFMMHYTVSALTDVSTCFIDARVFYDTVKNNSAFALQMLGHINRMGIQNFNKFINLTQKHMHGRIADAIFYLADRIHESDDFEPPISRQDLADMTAMTKESAIRILKDLKDNQTISVEGNHFRILNRAALEKISRTG